MMRENKIRSLNEDAQYHFQKEIESQRFAPAAHVLGGRRFDQHYIRFEGIGRGGIGSVWRGEHLKTGRPVAIKTLEGINEFANLGRKSTLKRSLERCLRSVAKLDHPFITPINDLNLHHTPPYYVMPLCEGGSLRDLLQKGPISPEVGLNWFIQIALGLHHAHKEGVMHLDLKPENILIDHRGNVSLFDFGMSRTMARQLSQVGRQSYVGFGSVAYMPPELLRNPHLDDPTIDIYALGLILYEILIGELPGRRSPMPSEVIQGLPDPVDQLFDQMAQDIPNRRLQSMDSVLELINQIPDFKRLSQKSMVMTFNQTPIELPGLTTLHLNEPEEWDIENDHTLNRLHEDDSLPSRSKDTPQDSIKKKSEFIHR
jgi:serine/threonine protein kinase